MFFELKLESFGVLGSDFSLFYTNLLLDLSNFPFYLISRGSELRLCIELFFDYPSFTVVVLILCIPSIPFK
jgi:hypothetical protein